MAEESVPRALRALPERPNLEHLRKEAKQRLKLLRQADLVAALANVLQPEAGQLTAALNELERCPAWCG